MANNPTQTWAMDPEEGAANTPSHAQTPGTSEPYADTNRFGGWQIPATKPIMPVENLVSSPVWGVNAPSAGNTSNTPMEPEIPVTKGE